MKNKRVVILSGPSCVGKGPLLAAVQRRHPHIAWVPLILSTSRKPRLKKHNSQYEVHGRDYYFLPRGLFATMNPQHFLVADVRSVVQAIDLDLLMEMLSEHDLILAELHTTLGRMLKDWIEKNRPDVEVIRIFLTPMSDGEIREKAQKEGKTCEETVYEIMKAKLQRRGEDAPEKIEDRASHAWGEIQAGKEYDHILVNPVGEDAINQWSDPLSPEAQRVMHEFVKILSEKS
ncbi:MAG: hypothetical protein JW828_00140 [Sedimentisphaerales bacterium]|nr:hypothetical protein [Sedimentisphaerales bacterium]